MKENAIIEVDLSIIFLLHVESSIGHSDAIVFVGALHEWTPRSLKRTKITKSALAVEQIDRNWT